VTPTGGVRGWFTPDHADPSLARRSGDDAGRATHLFVESPDGLLLPGRWSLVRLEYDRSRLLLTVDGMPLDELAADLPVRQVAGPMTVSATTDEGFRGALDKLVIAALDQGLPIDLPDQATFVAPTPDLVVFDSSGGLDARVHSGPVDVAIRFADGHEELVHVNPFGTVD
jgi:hypothetical protein